MADLFSIDVFVDHMPIVDKSRQILVPTKLPCVHNNDQEPVYLINPNLDKGPWLAGGACLRWYQNLSVGESDIDVFCKNSLQAQSTVDKIKATGRYVVKYDSDNATTLKYYNENGDEWIIQVIKRRYFESVYHLLHNFDITVCQVATTGNEWILGDLTAKDIREKNLRFKYPLQPDAVKRLVKYWTYGFRPVPGTIESIAQNPNGKWAFQNDDTYENAF